MDAGDPGDLATLVGTARTHAHAGRLDAAISVYRKILARDARHTEANAFLARNLLARRDAFAAVRHAELAIAALPADVALHQHLANAHAALLASGTGEAKLAAICDELPFAFTSLLHLARLHEVRKDHRTALTVYTRAIKTAYAAGFWGAEASTPPWLHPAVRHAHEVAKAGQRVLFEEWLRPLRDRYGKGELRRVEKCIAMYLGLVPTEIADPRQQPSFLYFPDLPITPLFDRDMLPFADWYEAETEAIRDEMLRVLDAGDGIMPFHYDVPEERRGKLLDGAWDAYFFFEDGVRDDRHHDACPTTSGVLARLPLDHIREHGPEVCFSVMRPGTTIKPHRGVTNTRTVLHLGLEIPDACALDLCGIQEVHWERGRCFAFDDTYEHGAWNRSDRTRVVLLGDIWNPHLRDPERAAIADLIGVIGDHNRAVAPRR
jgi:aspartate beta-hydroxylase